MHFKGEYQFLKCNFACFVESASWSVLEHSTGTGKWQGHSPWNFFSSSSGLMVRRAFNTKFLKCLLVKVKFSLICSRVMSRYLFSKEKKRNSKYYIGKNCNLAASGRYFYSTTKEWKLMQK